MIRRIVILFFIVMLYSCVEGQEIICFKIKNKSDYKVDSVKIKMGNISVKSEKAFNSDSLLKLRMKIDNKTFAENTGVGTFYYYYEGKGYWSNFGYFDIRADVKESYNLYIYNSGLSEIERETKFLKKNEFKED